MSTSFKTISISFDEEGARQIYIVESNVSEAQIRGGDETGVICLMIDEAKADLVTTLLNRELGDG